MIPVFYFLYYNVCLQVKLTRSAAGVERNTNACGRDEGYDRYCSGGSSTPHKVGAARIAPTFAELAFRSRSCGGRRQEFAPVTNLYNCRGSCKDL